MDIFEGARAKIFAEITTEDPEIRAEYLKHFESEAKAFSEVMAGVIQTWLKEHGDAQGNERRVQVFALVFTAIHLHKEPKIRMHLISYTGLLPLAPAGAAGR